MAEPNENRYQSKSSSSQNQIQIPNTVNLLDSGDMLAIKRYKQVFWLLLLLALLDKVLTARGQAHAEHLWLSKLRFILKPQGKAAQKQAQFGFKSQRGPSLTAGGCWSRQPLRHRPDATKCLAHLLPRAVQSHARCTPCLPLKQYDKQQALPCLYLGHATSHETGQDDPTDNTVSPRQHAAATLPALANEPVLPLPAKIETSRMLLLAGTSLLPAAACADAALDSLAPHVCPATPSLGQLASTL